MQLLQQLPFQMLMLLMLNQAPQLNIIFVLTMKIAKQQQKQMLKDSKWQNKINVVNQLKKVVMELCYSDVVHGLIIRGTQERSTIICTNVMTIWMELHTLQLPQLSYQLPHCMLYSDELFNWLTVKVIFSYFLNQK